MVDREAVEDVLVESRPDLVVEPDAEPVVEPESDPESEPVVEPVVGPASGSGEGEIDRWALVALLTTLVIDSTLAAAVAVLDVGYGEGVVHLAGICLWTAAAVINAVAAWNVAFRHNHGYPSALLAQAIALVLAGYVFLADIQSPATNALLRWAAAAVAVVAVGWIVFLAAKAPLSASRTFSTGWKVVSASFAVMSLFSLWLTTSYLPSQARPQVDLTTSLTKVEQNPKGTTLRATITLHNRGLAPAVVVGSLYRVHYENHGPVLPMTGGIQGFDGLVQDDMSVNERTTHQDDVLAGAFDFTAPNDHAFVGPSSLLKADEITPIREFLLPGQTWSTETVLAVSTGNAATVRLTAQIALITDRYLGDTMACEDGTANQHEAAFSQESHAVIVAKAPGREVHFLCVQTDLAPQSTVQNLVGDHPGIRTKYVLADGDVLDGRVPYLITSFESSGTSGDLEDAISQGNKIDATNPSAVIESRSEYGLPGA